MNIFYPIVTLVGWGIHCSCTININIAVLILHIVTVSDYTYQPPKDLRLNWGKSSEIHEMERVLPQWMLQVAMFANIGWNSYWRSIIIFISSCFDCEGFFDLSFERYSSNLFSQDSLMSVVWTFKWRPKLYIPSTQNIDLILWHTQWIVCAVKC